jgi:hypothetical protein
MKKLAVLIAAAGGLLAVLVIGSYAGHEKTKLKADTMIGYLEAPPISTGASGTFKATIDDDAQEIHYTLTYSGLEGDVRQSHIHFGQRGVSAGISAWLCETTFNE